MTKHRLSLKWLQVADSCGWVCALGLLVIAVVALYQIFLSVQSHIHQEVMAYDLTRVIG